MFALWRESPQAWLPPAPVQGWWGRGVVPGLAVLLRGVPEDLHPLTLLSSPLQAIPSARDRRGAASPGRRRQTFPGAFSGRGKHAMPLVARVQRQNEPVGGLARIQGVRTIQPGDRRCPAFDGSPEKTGSSAVLVAAFTFPLGGAGQDSVLAAPIPPTLPSLAGGIWGKLVSNLGKRS